MHDEAFYRSLIDNLFDGVYFVNRDRVITYWNAGAARLTGFAPQRVMGRSCKDNLLNHCDDDGCLLCTDRCPLLAAMETDQPAEAEVFMRHRDGFRMPVHVRISPMHDERGQVIGAVEVFSDASRLHHQQQQLAQLQKQAHQDSLTGLANRRHAEAQIAGRLEETRRYDDWSTGLLLADIDHFKRFNDTYGHNVGDEVLRMVAQTIHASLRPFDLAGRWGGEEFVALIANTNPPGLRRIADRVRRLIERSHLDGPDGPLQVTASIGGAVARPDDTVESLVARADEAMYDSKHGGRNRVTIWTARQASTPR